VVSKAEGKCKKKKKLKDGTKTEDSRYSGTDSFVTLLSKICKIYRVIHKSVKHVRKLANATVE
jgi:hypothetical protein